MVILKKVVETKTKIEKKEEDRRQQHTTTINTFWYYKKDIKRYNSSLSIQVQYEYDTDRK